MKQKLTEFLAGHSFLQRRDFEQLTGFNQSKATRYIRRLVEEGVLKNVGSKFHGWYLQPVITQYFVSYKSEIWA